MALAGHVLHAFIQARVAQRNGGIAVEQQFVNGFALFQPGQRTVLPQNGGGVGGGALEPLMAALKGPVAQLQTILKNLPELVQIAAGGQCHVRQVDGDHALIEAAVVLVLAGLVILGVGNVADTRVGEAVRRQEGAAAHAGIDVALQLPHLLLGDVVRHHAAGGAFGGQLCEIPVGGILGDVVLLQYVDQLGEGGGDPNAILILHALIPLEQHLLDDHGQIFLFSLVFSLAQIHEHGDEGSLSIGGQQRHHLILNGLNTAADLLP